MLISRNRAATAFIALAAALASGAGPITPETRQADRPNIVLFMVDDSGFSDFGCYGGEIRTPNIDRVAAEGLRFKRFYNGSRCCPTRASIMTGLFPYQVGITGMGRDLNRNAATVAESLRASGYQTAMAGKWHLSLTRPIGNQADGKEHLAWLNHQGSFDRPFADPSTYPINRGFERHYGPIWGVVDYFDPFSLVDGEEAVKTVPADFYMTDAITDKSVSYIDEMSKKADPFFLYVAHTAPHWPLHARAEDIARYKGRYDKGWHALRDERYARQVAMGLVDPATHPLPALMGRGPDWDALTPEARAFESSLMEVHAAMVDRVDQGLGTIVDALKRAGKYDNTLILILSDNGASPERGYSPGFDRPSETRAGTKIQYRGTFKPGAEDTWGYIGAHWANALNTPYRYWKAESFEGGCHTPLIASWPAGLKAKPGSTTDQVGHVIDVAPTCLALAGVEPPKTLGGRDLMAIEGKSLAPILADEQRAGHDALYFEHEGGRAIRADGWKLVAAQGKPWELYHVDVDATETKDVAAHHPDRVEAMSRRWADWARRVGADVPADPRRRTARPLPAEGEPISLRPGQVLEGVEAPRVANVPFRVDAAVKRASEGGVVVSQGAQVQGWALFVRDGKPAFAVRRDGKLAEVVADRPVGDGETTVSAELHPGGKVRLVVGGIEVASGTVGGLIPAQPNDPLIVGDDQAGLVGRYGKSARFAGEVVEAKMSAIPVH